MVYDHFAQLITREFFDIPGAMSLDVHPNTSRLFVTNEGLSRASVIDLVSGLKIADLPTGPEPDGIAVNETGSKIFVVSENAGLIHVFDGTSYRPIAIVKTDLRPRRAVLQDKDQLQELLKILEQEKIDITFYESLTLIVVLNFDREEISKILKNSLKAF